MQQAVKGCIPKKPAYCKCLRSKLLHFQQEHNLVHRYFPAVNRLKHLLTFFFVTFPKANRHNYENRTKNIKTKPSLRTKNKSHENFNYRIKCCRPLPDDNNS